MLCTDGGRCDVALVRIITVLGVKFLGTRGESYSRAANIGK